MIGYHVVLLWYIQNPLERDYHKVARPLEASMNPLAPKAVIDWLNGRAKGYTAVVGGEEVVANWSNGNVGYDGHARTTERFLSLPPPQV